MLIGHSEVKGRFTDPEIRFLIGFYDKKFLKLLYEKITIQFV